MEYDKATGAVSMAKAGGFLNQPKYISRFEPTLFFQVKYALTPDYTVTNEFKYMNKVTDQRRYSNMISLSAKLF
jgi:hypothetical protein